MQTNALAQIKNLKKVLFTSTLVKSSVVFIIINFINKAFPFILLPLFTRALSLSDYGTFALYRATSNFFIPLVGLSMSEAIIRNYYEKDKLDFGMYIGNVLLMNITTAFVYIFIIFFSGTIFPDLFGLPKYVLYLVVLFGFFSSVNASQRGLLRCENNNRSFAIQVLGQSVLYFLIITLAYFLKFFNLQYAIYGEAAVFLIFGSISIYYLNYKFKLKFLLSKKYLKDIFHYSVPLLINSLLAYTFALSDRFIINHQLNLSQVAIYAASFQVTSVTQILAVSLNAAWLPYVFGVLSKQESFKKIFKIQFLIAALYIVIGISYWIFLYFFLTKIIGHKYDSGKNFIHWFIGSNILQGCYWLLTPIIQFYKKNWLLVIGSVSALVLSLTLNLLFVKKFGVSFAATVNFLSWLLIFLITLFNVYNLLKKRKK
ncbi:Membrane protein involved in the export of O-antigen and teichoic acid [Halpernia humi]|uniref:Membrane protein involved in the export of O-antigen and teichoic acid n=1 Tax=Halpernia humi TaxID=493375 RepID=A0A1H6A4T5_9FLAO|nr:oligosaccharide flippase family protein [Halpernia humi]SEG42756.1 Membrane protein involved in the export of O-antigen and teichoic acid [Halpernia humi]